ncbi:hypothetical protein FRX31_016056 [Thalictrum thalictroides]|uniref:Uncharacterized protein n=1 Tax=Thalictrum thalictroides TaxID=46969 RepID=A0A7J6WCP1_THATH|nr:hypothetical protein FRX31_016056 [Thalictrum thalictroides]
MDKPFKLQELRFSRAAEEMVISLFLIRNRFFNLKFIAEDFDCLRKARLLFLFIYLFFACVLGNDTLKV